MYVAVKAVIMPGESVRKNFRSTTKLGPTNRCAICVHLTSKVLRLSIMDQVLSALPYHARSISTCNLVKERDLDINLKNPFKHWHCHLAFEFFICYSGLLRNTDNVI